MNLFTFDMDGVLLEPMGYHQALKDTVRLAGERSGFGALVLRDEQIAQFEALGISSEWHSSALCLAWAALRQDGRSDMKSTADCEPEVLDLEELFAAIGEQSIQYSSVQRGIAALTQVAERWGRSAECANGWLEQSESIRTSLTQNLFQEMVWEVSSSNEFIGNRRSWIRAVIWTYTTCACCRLKRQPAFCAGRPCLKTAPRS
jgi:hypothetical protein